MSQAGRYAHEQNKKRHNQGGVNRPKPQGIAGATWMTEGMEVCRGLQEFGGAWDVEAYMVRMGVDMAEAESQLRYLSQLGFLRMSFNKEWKRYEWQMDQPNLPRKEDLR